MQTAKELVSERHKTLPEIGDILCFRSGIESAAGLPLRDGETLDRLQQNETLNGRSQAAVPVSRGGDHGSQAKLSRISVGSRLSKWATAQLSDFACPSGLTLETLFTAAWAHLAAAFSTGEFARVWRYRTTKASEASERSLEPILVPTGASEEVSEWLSAVAKAMEEPAAEAISPAATDFREAAILFSSAVMTPQLSEQIGDRVLLHVREKDTISLSLSYPAGTYSDQLAQTLLACLEAIAVQLPRAGNSPVHKLDLIPAPLKAQYLAAPEGAPVDAEAFKQLVHELIAEQVRSTPDKVAVIGASEHLSYADLDRRANQLAHRLQRMGVSPDHIVAVHLKRTVDLMIAILAILKAGAAYLPLDASLPPGRVQTVLSESQAAIVITSGALEQRLHNSGVQVLCLDRERLQLNSESDAAPVAAVRPDHLVYVTYTSGSTGKPKGVMVEHRNLVASFAGMEQMFGSEPGIWLAAANISFDISITELVWTLTKGSTIVLHEGDEGKPIISGTNSIAEQFIAHRITHFQATPALAQIMLCHPNGQAALKGLRKMSVGGEAFPQGLAAALLKVMPGEVVNAYGPTETTVCAAFHPVHSADRAIPIGKSMLNARLYVLDKWGRLLPPFASGELFIGGPIVSRGYHRRPDLTAERFLPNPFAEDAGARLYRTGDAVRFNAAGELEFLARTDAQVKVNGYRIELGEIEAVLNSHPLVQQSAVVLQKKGTSQRLVGYFQTEPGTTVAPAGLRDHLRCQLPEYMVPPVLVRLEQFPITASGKVDRTRLPEPDSASTDRSADTPDQTALPLDRIARQVESDLCSWCRELIHLSSVSPLDDFFEIGGHSLVAAEIVHRIAKKYNIHLRLSTFVKARKIRAIALLVRHDRGASAAQSSECSPLVTIRGAGSKPPVFLLSGIGGSIVNFELLARSLDPDRPIYAIETNGLDLHNSVLTTIEDMARLYLDEIRKIQPTGPYHLIGYSFGGVVAYEMAHQLTLRGESAAIIGMIDTSEYSYQQTVVAGLRPAERWQSVYRDRLRRLVFGPFRINAFIERMRVKFVKSVFALASKFGRPLPAAIGKAEDRNFYAMNRYTPQPCQQPIHLFRCIDTDRFDGTDPLLGWGRLANEIVVHPVPGQHGAVIREPHVHTLGAALEACLLQSERAASAAEFSKEAIYTESI